MKRTPLRRTPFKRKPKARQYEDSSKKRLRRLDATPIKGNVMDMAREYASVLADNPTKAEDRFRRELMGRCINYLYQYPLYIRNEQGETVRFYKYGWK